MQNPLARHVRRVAVTDPVAAAHPYSYADAFEVRLPAPDPHPPEAWLRAGLAATPGWVDRVVDLLGFRGAPGAADHVSGFRIVDSGPEVVQLETSLPLMRVVMVGRNVGPMCRTLTTVVYYERPRLARPVFAVIGVGHRWAVRQVITSKVASS